MGVDGALTGKRVKHRGREIPPGNQTMKPQDTRMIAWLAVIICIASVLSAQPEGELAAQGSAAEIVSTGS